MRGARVQAIMRELRGERIDIIQFSDDLVTYAQNALSPAKITRVSVMPGDEEEEPEIGPDGEPLEPIPTLECIVEEDQLSLAIGKRGQNVRLAAALIGAKIEIKSEQAVKAEVARGAPADAPLVPAPRNRARGGPRPRGGRLRRLRRAGDQHRRRAARSRRAAPRKLAAAFGAVALAGRTSATRSSSRPATSTRPRRPSPSPNPRKTTLETAGETGDDELEGGDGARARRPRDGDTRQVTTMAAKFTVTELAKMMGKPPKEVLFLLQGIGVDVKSVESVIEGSTAQAILTGKTQAPKSLIVRQPVAAPAAAAAAAARVKTERSALKRIKIIERPPDAEAARG